MLFANRFQLLLVDLIEFFGAESVHREGALDRSIELFAACVFCLHQVCLCVFDLNDLLIFNLQTAADSLRLVVDIVNEADKI